MFWTGIAIGILAGITATLVGEIIVAGMLWKRAEADPRSGEIWD